ncbi:cubilin-like [Penaeus monodon]|uniref:cubilin-like n=1 Tax=Penaeus monodon TaxID=6687 RepID=UPI0018A712F1|nr:cubilin-like [Penaeus monodon]
MKSRMFVWIVCVLVLPATTVGQVTTTAAPPAATTAAPAAATAAAQQNTTSATDICLNATSPAANEVWLTTGSFKRFNSAKYPSTYGSGDGQEWVFCATNPADRIMITCSDFQVGGFFFDCVDDSLTISNANSSNSKYCTTNGPQLVQTTERGTKVTFTASTSNVYKGFTCTAQAVRETNCQSAINRASYEVWLANGTSETFTSPNYPSNYGRGDSKRWVFCAIDPDDRIQISCNEFTVGGFFFDCTDDTLTISNTDSNGKFCLNKGPLLVDTIERGTEVKLSTSSPYGYKGFTCTATALRTPCRDPKNRASNEIWLENDQVEPFTSSGYPASNYGNDDTREWRFCAVDSSDKIEVTCSAFHVGGAFFDCLDDTFTISTLNSTSKFCGITGPSSVTTNERGTSVKLRVYTGEIYDGFSCSAKAIRAEICMNVTNPANNEVWLQTGKSEAFTSQNYPSNYGSGASEKWVFCAVNDTDKISISCSDFEVGGKFIFCLDDFLTISNTNSGQGPYCGTDKPDSVVTTQRGTTVELSVSPSVYYKGFNCTATAVNQ